MTGPVLDLTAAIEAAADAIQELLNGESAELESQGMGPTARLLEASNAITAALPHVREALALQIEQAASGPDTSCATDSVLHEAARIVRGEA